MGVSVSFLLVAFSSYAVYVSIINLPVLSGHF